MPTIRELATPIVIRNALDHEDSANRTFLLLLEADIREGRNVRALPEKLAGAMLANVGYAENFDEEMEGEVAL